MKEIRIQVELMADCPEGTDEFSAAQLVVRQVNDVLQDNSARCYGAQIGTPTAETEISVSHYEP